MSGHGGQVGRMEGMREGARGKLDCDEEAGYARQVGLRVRGGF